MTWCSQSHKHSLILALFQFSQICAIHYSSTSGQSRSHVSDASKHFWKQKWIRTLMELFYKNKSTEVHAWALVQSYFLDGKSWKAINKQGAYETTWPPRFLTLQLDRISLRAMISAGIETQINKHSLYLKAGEVIMWLEGKGRGQYGGSGRTKTLEKLFSICLKLQWLRSLLRWRKQHL